MEVERGNLSTSKQTNKRIKDVKKFGKPLLNFVKTREDGTMFNLLKRHLYKINFQLRNKCSKLKQK